jgi:hypothetical protein
VERCEFIALTGPTVVRPASAVAQQPENFRRSDLSPSRQDVGYISGRKSEMDK